MSVNQSIKSVVSFLKKGKAFCVQWHPAVRLQNANKLVETTVAKNVKGPIWSQCLSVMGLFTSGSDPIYSNCSDYATSWKLERN